jgi:magnesium-transporting ATPase (P-type)
VTLDASAAATGLDGAAVRARVAAGQVNTAPPGPGRTVGQILRANVLTRFNAILGTMFVVVVAVGPPQDALFGIVLVVNAGFGVIQELRAKRTLDRLAILTAARARVVREGVLGEIPAGLLVVISEFFRSHDPLEEAVRGSAAAVVAMVPEGLVLLTSLAFTAGAMRLARRRVLVQELAAVEGLARVDVLCIDKTGTRCSPWACGSSPSSPACLRSCASPWWQPWPVRWCCCSPFRWRGACSPCNCLPARYAHG